MYKFSINVVFNDGSVVSMLCHCFAKNLTNACSFRPQFPLKYPIFLRNSSFFYIDVPQNPAFSLKFFSKCCISKTTFYQQRNYHPPCLNPPRNSVVLSPSVPCLAAGDPSRQARLRSRAERWIGGLLGTQRTWQRWSCARQGGVGLFAVLLRRCFFCG